MGLSAASRRMQVDRAGDEFTERACRISEESRFDPAVAPPQPILERQGARPGENQDEEPRNIKKSDLVAGRAEDRSVRIQSDCINGAEPVTKMDREDRGQHGAY